MLPEGIPTVTVTGRYLSLDDKGKPLSGQVIFRAPSLVTFPEWDVILGGAVTASLDATGAFSVELPATDAPGMNPAGWSYQVAEQLAGVPTNRVYQVLLPAETPAVDIADIAPTDPTTPIYVAVRGDSAYEVAVKEGFAGTVTEWLASLAGPPGANGADGTAGADGAPGVVQSVNGQATAAVVLDADDVGAIPATGYVAGGNLILNSATGDYRGFSFTTADANRWVFQVDNVAEAGADVGSNFELANWGDDGNWKSAVLFGDRGTGNLGIGTNGLIPDAKVTVAGGAALKNVTVPPATPTGAAVLYSEGGALKVVTPGARFTVAEPVPLAQKGAASGVAPLDATSKVPVGNLPILSAVKTGDTSRSNATLAADPNLTLTVAANARYIVLGTLVWTANPDKAAGGMNVGWVAPSGATMAWTDNDSGGAAAITSTLSFGQTMGTLVTGVLVTGGTAGTFALRWAQAATNATATVLKSGAGLTLIRIA